METSVRCANECLRSLVSGDGDTELLVLAQKIVRICWTPWDDSSIQSHFVVVVATHVHPNGLLCASVREQYSR